MPSTTQGWRARWSRARTLTMVAVAVSAGSVVVAISMPVTILSWCLGAVAGAAAMSAIGAARRMGKAAREVTRLEAERDAMLADQRRVRERQAAALARLEAGPPSSGPISTIPPSGPISSMSSGPISSMPSGPISSPPSGPISSLPSGPISSLPSAPTWSVPADRSSSLPSLSSASHDEETAFDLRQTLPSRPPPRPPGPTAGLVPDGHNGS